MKVLQITNSLKIGGAEKLVVDSVPLYQKRGIAMDVVTLDNTKTSFSDLLIKESSGKVIGLTSRSVYNPFLIFKIIPLFKKYDLIHIHLFPTLYWVVLAKIFSFSKTPLIYTEHNTSNRRRNNFIFKFLDKFIYRRLVKIVTIADEVDEEIKKHLEFSDQCFQLIQNGVDVSFFKNSTGYSKSDFFENEDMILIQVSSFRAQKDQNTLIRSLQFLPENVKLLLVGSGPLLDDSKTLVHELLLTEKVKFLGLRSDVSRLIKTADIVVLSSRHEGLSLSNIEGMSASRPFVASNVPGLREIVQDHGILFEKGNAEDLALIIKSLLEDPMYFNEIADKCYNRAKEFDIDKMISSYAELYEEVLNG